MRRGIMMDQKNDTFRVIMGAILSIIAVVAIALSFQNRMSNADNKTLKSQEDQLVRDIGQTKRETLSYTPERVNKDIKQQKIDVTQSMAKARNQLTRAFTQTYSKTRNDSQYKALKKDLPKLVGTELSDKLVSLTEPALGQDGTNQFPFAGLASLHIAFGKYTLGASTIPVYVVAEYKEPRTSIKLTGKNAPKINAQTKKQVFFNVMYHMQDDSYTLEEYDTGKTNGQGE